MERIRVDFWLQPDKPGDLWLLDVIEDLKSCRQFTKAIRDAMRLIVSLRAGQVDVLFELFPWVQYQQLPGQLPPPVYKLPPAQPADLVTQIVEAALDLVS